MFLKLLLIIPLFFIAPEVNVRWAPGGHALRIAVENYDRTLLEECIKSGLEVRYRYYVRLCRERWYWLDRCGEERREVKSVQFDPISETYRVSFDRLHDGLPPRITSLDSLGEAFSSISEISELSLDNLNPQPSTADQGYSYAEVRTISECKGQYNESMERLSYVLSLGLVSTSGFDSGWITFRLDK